MPKPIEPPESFFDLEFPTRGIDVSRELEKQPAQTTPSGINVRTFEPETERARGGDRPGLVRYLPLRPTGGRALIQMLNSITIANADFLAADGNQAEGADYIDDPSSGVRNPHRRVRRRGSGRQPNRHVPKPQLIVLANDQTKAKGDTFTFAGTEYTTSGLTGGDTVTTATISSTGSPALAEPSDYPILISQLQGTVSGSTLAKKYKITYQQGTMTVIDGIRFVQGGSGGVGSSSIFRADGATQTVDLFFSFTGDNTGSKMGNFFLLFISDSPQFGTPPTMTAPISDTQGNTYTAITANLYWTILRATSDLTVTVTVNVPDTSGLDATDPGYMFGLGGSEFSGVDPVSPIDSFVSHSGSSSSIWTTGSITAAADNEMLIGCFWNGGKIATLGFPVETTDNDGIFGDYFVNFPWQNYAQFFFGRREYPSGTGTVTTNVARGDGPPDNASYKSLGVSIKPRPA